MPALIVGASGQLGTALMRALGPDQALATFYGRPLADGLRLPLETLELRAARQLLRVSAIDAVYCCGAATHVDACEDDPERAFKVNRDGPAALAEAAAELGIPYAYVSTDFVFDGASGPYSEEDEPRPLSVYGASKLAGERAVMAAHPRALIVRTTLVYGPDPQGKNFGCTVRRLLSQGQPMRVAVDQSTTPTFNVDLALGLCALLGAGAHGVFHLAGEENMSRFEFATRVCRAAGLDARLLIPTNTRELSQRAVRPLSSGLRLEKLRNTLPNLRIRSVDVGLHEWLSAT